MTESKSKNPNMCQNSGLPSSDCSCLECEYRAIDPGEWFIDCTNIDMICTRLEMFQKLSGYLDEGAFCIRVGEEGVWRLTPPIVSGHYWVQCRGCHYPHIVELGKDSDVWCAECFKKLEGLKGQQPRYYINLFEYIDMKFELARIEERKLKESHGFTREFCAMYGFDFDAVVRRLKAAHGFDDGEVMMNSTSWIPWFHELPCLNEEDEVSELTNGGDEN